MLSGFYCHSPVYCSLYTLELNVQAGGVVACSGHFSPDIWCHVYGAMLCILKMQSTFLKVKSQKIITGTIMNQFTNLQPIFQTLLHSYDPDKSITASSPGTEIYKKKSTFA